MCTAGYCLHNDASACYAYVYHVLMGSRLHFLEACNACVWLCCACLAKRIQLDLCVAGAVSRGASEAVNSKLATFASAIALVVGAGVLLSGWGVALPFSFSLM